MQIYVVKQGDSLYQIANQFGTSYQSIANVNEIDPSLPLVVGQALVIPIYGQFYTVQPGDSLYTIGQRFGISAAELASVNQINMYQPLSVGMTLYIPESAKRTIETNAYIEPTGGSVSDVLENAARKHVDNLTYLAPFSFQVDRQGNLIAPPLNDFNAIASEQNATLMLVVTNLEEGAFSQELGRLILTDETVQNNMLDQIIATAKESGFGDIHFDFEFLPPENREDYRAFLEKATTRLHNEGFLVSTALAPKTSAEQEGNWYEAHDYQAHGEIVDFVVLMTYEWGYSGGPAMAVSPIGPVRDVVNYALTEMPSEKIMLGQNLYGYDWTLPYEPGGEYAKALSPQQAIQVARDNNQAILFDEEAKAPYFRYVDQEGQEHEVWFEDARSIQAKFDLIKEKNLRGISYWKLGLSFPQNWLLLEDQFTIRKRG
ncbi:LysM peptidoglycan-binding domain-containing protein [Gracilibacillus salinarum]|uniref:Glycoside hydrolase family 18 protein n=1 Tax=Gracilibacillus salinarum TaxID=2932255 RepID=A0ABY4GI15_9BACI|nr:glycoside hydrolase family 18 protein [Gracilibacillus salinarum]UOQ83819.1 glycoside hydrolase family 18 protein [Gracilibacillus salinarum]